MVRFCMRFVTMSCFAKGVKQGLQVVGTKIEKAKGNNAVAKPCTCARKVIGRRIKRLGSLGVEHVGGEREKVLIETDSSGATEI